ncbi:AAA domain-containing protein [candidate division KSB1 bacterium]|nr:AAA domain-containing protein [candidate division KSB1 bacterium]NIR72683.1 AAA domain-containing protein [candidate division KSB1 bacterium]NIS28210.1 AAA domain-containing protein [candidate division KSB1 bacterium]NIT75099.1 AAA domain-containing protein [candidate division KSB1 bacterium]NIU28886.1 AAA domain-containing protein [candidate division KSB1 bacterium]
MKKVFSLIDTVAPTNAAVLINGETGTGKELVARAIHERSGRANGPFVPVHCSAITSSLLESDLFGHTKGAFTGAIRDKPGRFEMAEGGTIFLDEIATLSPEIQVSLLRVLQEKTIEPVGGTKSITVDVRIISATNRRLPALIQQNVFRKDLYYRVNVLQISLPPLRKRIKDIPALTSHFIEKYNRQHGCNIVGISREANKILTSYSWPGNVRELENAIEHAVILGQHNLIEPWHLPEEIREVEKNKLSFPSTGTFPISEEDKIRNALAKTAGNVTRAAHILGIHRTTLWRKMRELKIPRLPEML